MTVYRSKSKVGTGFAIYAYTGSDDPLTDPLNHISELRCHSDFDYYTAASGFPQDVTVSHSAITADPGTNLGTSAVQYITYNSVTQNDYTLATHGLGYVPNFMVAVDGIQYPAACPVQIGDQGARRSICFWADTTKIYVHEHCLPSIPGLAALSVTYHVTVFRAPDAIGSKLVDATASQVRLAYGKIDSAERMAREPDTGETIYSIPTGRTMDINNGRYRFVLPDGSLFQVSPVWSYNTYRGSFTGVPSKGIAI